LKLIEANPTSAETWKLDQFKAAGVNRLSMGIQSLNDKDLKFFSRDHTASSAMDAIFVAMSLFKNISLDFIWGRPGQTLQGWEKELNEIMSFNAPHLSLYQLTVDRGTKLWDDVQSSHVKMPSDGNVKLIVDEMADMFFKTQEVASAFGYRQYETSSFAKNDSYQSRHNQSYWNGSDYLGIGPGIL
jgi:coproporphyrinogen III oxidase-like Fe-S oxidoreductase